jgi:hypothetical protein
MSQRENITMTPGPGPVAANADGETEGGGLSPLRAALVRPESLGNKRVPAVIINRGLASGEADNDVLDALAGELAEAGAIAVLLEPRTAHLILDDFNAFRLSDEIDDVLAAAAYAAARPDVDPARIGLIGWSLGAVAVSLAPARLEGVRRVCLVNPATPGHIISRLARREALASDNEPIPMAFVAALADLDAAERLAGHEHATLIVHAGADRFIPPAVSLEYLAALERAQRSVERVLVARADHAFTDADARLSCAQRVAAFFAQAPAARPMRVPAVGVLP